ncbi:MAG: extracellular solute-binding protein [Chloroflexi bacterium]|nr:extracellular solute-binding protein [Chloroflexota bacterium]MBU1746339.1 extracellular solute-binding protein [Chloroflexota bacterium]
MFNILKTITALLVGVAIVLVVITFVASAWAVLPAGCPPNCLGADLRDKNLVGVDLSQANLSGVDLSRADLRGANLRGANLIKATLTKANLDKADLSGANLRGADLTQATLTKVNLENANLSGANLTGAVLTGVDLTTVDLTAAVLGETRLIGANLKRTSLSGADLSGANLRGAQLNEASLNGANLAEADLSGTDMTGAALRGALLNDATLIGTQMVGVDLSGTVLRASLYGVDLSGANLSGADLVGAELVGVKLYRAVLVNANLISADLNGVDLREADLRGAKLWVSDLSTAEFNALARDPNLAIEDAHIHGYEIDDKIPTQAQGQITLYTSIPQDIIDKIQSDFQAKFPQITLNVFRAGSSSVVDKLTKEKAAGAIQADLVWLAEPAVYEDFKEQGMLLEYSPPESVFLPAEMKDPDGYWYAGRLINVIIAYNTTGATQPKSWLDLRKPEYKDRLSFVSPLGSSAAEAAVKTLVDKYSWKYFEDLKANGCVSGWNNPTVQDQVATGELMAGVLLDYYVRGARYEGKPVKDIWPEDGAVLVPSPMAILNTTQNPLAAKVFVDYVLSKDGQETMVKLGNFIPVRYDIDPPEGAPPLNQIKRLPTDWKALQKERETIRENWVNIFGEDVPPPS